MESNVQLKQLHPMQATWSSMLLANTLKDGALDYMHVEKVRLQETLDHLDTGSSSPHFHTPFEMARYSQNAWALANIILISLTLVR